MKTIIAGPLRFTDYSIVCDAVKLSGFDISEVVSGGAADVDVMAQRWSREHGKPVRFFIADAALGRKARFKRNAEMAAYAEALIALWDGVHPGTADMIRRARCLHRKVYVHRVERQKPRGRLA
jgi:hypothetical protein